MDKLNKLVGMSRLTKDHKKDKQKISILLIALLTAARPREEK